MQEAHQKIRLHDLARAIIYAQTASEKKSNEQAQQIMSGDTQDELVSNIYSRIAQKKPHVVSQLYYLGISSQQSTNQPAESTENGYKSTYEAKTQVADRQQSIQQEQQCLLNEIVSTQITQVAYSLRQNKRAFDTACMLELLCKDFLSRKSCIEPSRDLSKSPSDEFRPSLFKMTQNAKMVQLLLALSKNPSDTQEKSEFGKNYLRCKMRLNEDQHLFVRPHLAEFMQSDCQEIERDKTVGGRHTYLSYDTKSFHNPLFKNIEVKPIHGAAPYRLQNLTGEVNRFNCDLVKETLMPHANLESLNGYRVGVSASDGHYPAPLLGATLRSLDQVAKTNSGKGGLFGAGENSISAFGMTLQIPQLPPIDQGAIFNHDGQIDEAQVVPTFSFFQPCQTDDGKTKIEQPASKGKARLTIIAQNSNPNRRQQKQDYKKNKREVSVWSLLPYVNEKLLDHNMAEESGIQRMWEDESIHIHMRNLSVCEPGVITTQKEASFRACFKASVGSVFRVPGSSKIIKERDLVRSLILVLQGIPSLQVFELEKTTFTFNTNPNLTISDLCCTSASLQELCSEFTQAGCYFLHLREFSEFMSSHNVQAGQVVEAFALAIQDFLVFYQHQVNELERKAGAFRQNNEKVPQDTSNGEKLGQMNVSLLEIKVLMAPLLAQIQTIASICFTTKFIKDIQRQQQLKKVGGGENSANQSLDEPNDEFKFMSLLFQRNALTAANLKEQMEVNLEKIRSEQWLNEFPKGARLLTYLYRIMLASEADLQVIDLLRRIFTQSVRPILLMISAFITIGSFEDPFQEFFVEKLYRTALSKDKPSTKADTAKFADRTDDYIFKISSDADKIPVFLNDTAVTIFKIGCDLNLLKTKRQQILIETQQSSAISTPMISKATATRVNLPDYFAICAQGHSENAENSHYSTRLRMVDQASRVLTLDFQVETLQRKHMMDSRLFEHQSNLLQKIEQQIAQEETDALLQIISLREKAAIFKATDFEKNRLIVARKRDEEKRKYMQQIEKQIKERKQNREAQQQVELQERQKIEQEQLEYKQMQKEIAENLRSQLMELLKANQSIADTRTEDAIQKEALEHQLSELEQKAERAKQEVQREQNIFTSADQEMKDESSMKPDEQAMLVDSKPQAATIVYAGKASTTQEGGLARLLFGKGEPVQVEQQIPQKIAIVKDGSPNQKHANEEVKLDDIQIDLTADEKKLLSDKDAEQNPEKIEEQTFEEKVEFIKKVFLQPLLSRVFKFVDEKQAMDSKRKTWNLQHQVSQVEDFRRQKKNWEYKPTQEKSLRDRMDAIFNEHKNENRVLEETNLDEEPIKTEQPPIDEMFKVPVSLAIQQSIIQVVNHQHKLVNKCLLHMMHRGMFLLRHFEYLKMVFLASQGDVFASFHESVFNDDFQQTAKDSSLQFLNMQLELAVRSSRPECNYRTRQDSQKNDQSGAQNISKPIELGVNLAQLISEDGTELTKFRFVPSGRSSQLDINPNFFFTISNIGEFVRLDYSTEHPLDRVISQQCMNKYNTLFFFLLKLKRTNHCLTLIWKELNGVEFRRISAADFRQLRKLQFLWQQMQYFLKTIDEYVMVAVIHSQWTILKKQLAQIDYFEELINLHNSYLDTILEKCFLGRARDNRLQITLNQIFEFVFKLHFLVRNHGVDITREFSAKQELQNISVQFRDYSRFLYQIVRNLAMKGQFKELFIRLDFNKFYQNSAGATSVPTLTVSRNIIKQ